MAEQVEELGQDLAPAVRHRALEVGLRGGLAEVDGEICFVSGLSPELASAAASAARWSELELACIGCTSSSGARRRSQTQCHDSERGTGRGIGI